MGPNEYDHFMSDFGVACTQTGYPICGRQFLKVIIMQFSQGTQNVVTGGCFTRKVFSFYTHTGLYNKLCGRTPQYTPPPVTMTFDLLTLKVVSESRVTWATSVPILVFLGLSVLDLGPMYATDRQTDRQRDRQTDIRCQTASSPNVPAQGAGHNNSGKDAAKSSCSSGSCALHSHITRKRRIRYRGVNKIRPLSDCTAEIKCVCVHPQTRCAESCGLRNWSALLFQMREHRAAITCRAACVQWAYNTWRIKSSTQINKTVMR